tara:strand:- start:2957 stop:3856 length:900 start_codon:yes stop_codon:yes gene_type:complete
MKRKTITFWPKPSSIKFLSHLNFMSSERQIEKLLSSLFPSGHPVLLSSGRSAIYLALLATESNRSKRIQIFEYASHCVLDAISRIATPFGFNDKNTEYKIHYHQWGYTNKILSDSILIEDSVDTLYVPGTPLFQCNGDFEIWSLTKTLGTFTGGVLWCKSKKVAVKCRRIRDSHKRSNLQLFLKIFSEKFNFLSNFWFSREAVNMRLSLFSLGEIEVKIKHWSEEVEGRINKLKILNLYPRNKLKRLPSAIPIDFKKVPTSIKNLFEFKIRHFNGKTVFPLPIHHQVSDKILLKLKKYV